MGEILDYLQAFRVGCFIDLISIGLFVRDTKHDLQSIPNACLKTLYHCQQPWPDADMICQNMVGKIMKYDVVFCSNMAKLAKIDDLRLGSNILADTDILRCYVVLPLHSKVTKTSSRSPILDPNSPQVSTLCRNSFTMTLSSQPVRCQGYFIFTFNGHWGQTSGPIWIKLCERKELLQHRSGLPRLTGDPKVFGLQWGVFSIAGYLLDISRTRLSDESILSLLLFHAWKRLFV